MGTGHKQRTVYSSQRHLLPRSTADSAVAMNTYTSVHGMWQKTGFVSTVFVECVSNFADSTTHVMPTTPNLQ